MPANPARADNEYPVAYFWEKLCQPDAWLRVFHSFVYVEKKDVVDLKGNWSRKETLIFPRFGDVVVDRDRRQVSVRCMWKIKADYQMKES